MERHRPQSQAPHSIVVNGDIQTADDALHLLQDIGVDGIMIGRAATARPWMIWQIAHHLGFTRITGSLSVNRRPPQRKKKARLLQAMAHYCDLLDHYFEDDEKKLRRLRFHVINANKWLHFGHAYYSKCMKAKTLADVKSMTLECMGAFEFPYGWANQFAFEAGSRTFVAAQPLANSWLW